METCPSPEQLEKLFEDQLSEPEQKSIEDHIGECLDCQKTLQEISHSGRWNRLQGLLKERPVSTVEFSSSEFTSPENTKTVAQTDEAETYTPQSLHPKIPDYEILQELGRGGMGVVYKARQVSLKRVVALKVILAGDLAGPDQIARFHAEAEAVARLQHPNIVQIYAIGEHKQIPFISFEYIVGGTLAQNTRGTPQPPRRAAELVEVLARAIFSAHQQGLVHRDLKPANILLTKEGEPKITDFGLVKRLEEDYAQTKTGFLLGTPHYMAPEQTTGDPRSVGTPADIFSLGVILYELLTGRVPFQAPSIMQTIDLVRNNDPVSPRQLQGKIPRDLETICLKCLQKNPAKRYATALQFADDINRFLNNQPIEARPVGVIERTIKWIKRRPGTAATLGVSLVATVVLIVMGVWSYLNVQASAERAEEKLRFAGSVVDEMYTRVAENWLANEPLQDPLRKDFLEKALKFYLAVSEEKSDDPVIQAKTARAFFRVGQIYRVLNQFKKAEKAYNQTIALQKKLLEDSPAEANIRANLAESYNWLGELYREKGQSLDAAEANYHRARKIQEQLVKEFPDRAIYQRHLARSCYNLGIVHQSRGQNLEAENYFDQAIHRLGKLPEKIANDPAYAYELALSHINRGTLHKQLKEIEKAENDYRRAISLLQANVEKDHSKAIWKRDLAVAHQDLGNLLFSMGKPKLQEAQGELEMAEKVLVELVTDFPTRKKYQAKLATTYNSIGSVHWKLGRKGKAEENWNRSLKLYLKLVHTESNGLNYYDKIGTVEGNIALLKYGQKDLKGARRSLQDAIQNVRKALNARPENLEIKYNLRVQYRNLAEILVQSKDHIEAVKVAQLFADVFPDRPLDSYYAACFIARSLKVLQEDDKLKETEKQNLEKEYRAKVFALLEETLGQPGPLNRLPNEKEIFAPLWNDSEFSQIMVKLESRAPTPTGNGEDNN